MEHNTRFMSKSNRKMKKTLSFHRKGSEKLSSSRSEKRENCYRGAKKLNFVFFEEGIVSLPWFDAGDSAARSGVTAESLLLWLSVSLGRLKAVALADMAAVAAPSAAFSFFFFEPEIALFRLSSEEDDVEEDGVEVSIWSTVWSIFFKEADWAVVLRSLF